MTTSPRFELTRTTLADRVYEGLKDDILNNRLLPETPLQEATLARDIGVSRGPVREALQKLAADGLVEIIPHKGAVVTSLTPEEFIDAYRVREALEVLAIRLATPHFSEEDLDTLDALHEQMIKHTELHDIDGFFSANAAFHNTIVETSGNAKLIELYHPLMDQMKRYRMRSVALRGGLARSCDEHARILDALRQRDPNAAASLLAQHIQIPQQMLEQGEQELELVHVPSE